MEGRVLKGKNFALNVHPNKEIAAKSLTASADGEDPDLSPHYFNFTLVHVGDISAQDWSNGMVNHAQFGKAPGTDHGAWRVKKK